MTTLSLSQRLVHLRGMIADSIESTSILKQFDLLISFAKQMQLEKKDQIIGQLQLKIKGQTERIKQLKKDKDQLQTTLDNMSCDLEIITVKCRNLQNKLKEIDRREGRQIRVQQKQAQKKTKEIQVQVEILSQHLMDDISRCYKIELKENEILKKEIEELKQRESIAKMQLSLHQTTITEIDLEEINDTSASFLQPRNQQNSQNHSNEETPQQPTTVQSPFLNLLWTTSRQIMTYFKDQ